MCGTLSYRQPFPRSPCEYALARIAVLWEILWGLQRYKVKKPAEKVIFDFGIADLDLKVLNPHKRAAWGCVGAVGFPVMFLLKLKN